MSTGKSIYEAFKTSEQAENEGQWFNYGPGPLGSDQRFLLARTSRANKRYTEAIRRMSEKYGQQIEAKTLSDDVAFEMMLKIFCTTVLIDWDGIAGPDGNELPYSVDAAVMLMRDLPDLYADLQANAGSREHYLQKQLEADAGN
jgi:hypothetical protein